MILYVMTNDRLKENEVRSLRVEANMLRMRTRFTIDVVDEMDLFGNLIIFVFVWAQLNVRWVQRVSRDGPLCLQILMRARLRKISLRVTRTVPLTLGHWQRVRVYVYLR